MNKIPTQIGRRLALGLSCIALIALAGCTETESDAKSTANMDLNPEANDIHRYLNAVIIEKEGEALYEKNCASCHDGGVHRGPDKSMVALMSANSIFKALTDGVMTSQAQGLSVDDKQRVAEYLANSRLKAASNEPELTMCTGDAAKFNFNEPPTLQGWGFTSGNSHYIDSSQTSITRQNVDQLTLKWTFAFPDALRARSRPTLAAGAVFVGSHNGRVYALDQETACVRWVFSASAEVRNGLVVTPWQAGEETAEPLVFFGDLIGYVYAVNAITGELVWRDRSDGHPSSTITGAASLFDNVLYVPVSSLEVIPAFEPDYECCTFRGSVVAYDALTGTRLWQAFTTDMPTPSGVTASGTTRMTPSGAPVWNSPTIDKQRNQIVFGTGENYTSPATGTSDAIMAVDIKTGAVNWVYQATAGDAWNTACVKGGNSAHPTAAAATSGPNCPVENGPDVDFGAGAILATTKSGKDLILAGQKSGDVHALDPATGELIWKTKVGRGSLLGGINFGMAVANDSVFVPIADVKDGSGETPAGIFVGARHPGLHAVDLNTGEMIWRSPMADTCEGKSSCLPGIAQAVAATDELVFAGGMDGVLRIYDTESGEVLWEYQTAKGFTGSNGVEGIGGSFAGGSGPVAYGNMLFASSGYAFNGLMPGNVLLAFELLPEKNAPEKNAPEKQEY